MAIQDLTPTALLLALLLAPAQSAVDDAFARFWRAESPAAAEQTIDAIVRSGVTFADALARLRAGRPYDPNVPTGVVHDTRAGRFPYTLDVPPGYTPDRRYQVRVQLHGGISRAEPAPAAGGIGRMAGVEQIYVLPAGWRGAMWWTDTQVENLRAILDTVKRTYNVDENHVALSGISDGGTGAYYVAMRDLTPYSSVLSLIGFAMVLQNPDVGVVGDVFPSNWRNRPFFVVNSGRDRLYPTGTVEPYVLGFARQGVQTVWRPQPEAGHDTSWWPDVKDEFERFVADHPRDPLPDHLSWETSDLDHARRMQWLVIDELGAGRSDPASMDDLNTFTPEQGLELGLRVNDRTVVRVLSDTNAERLGFQAGDVILRMEDRAIENVQELLAAVAAHPIGAPVRWRVSRDGREVELSGTFAPVEARFPARPLFRRTRPSGHVELTRQGNRVEVTSRGVREFTLLLSPDEFDFSQPVTVVTNGRVAFSGRVELSLETLLRWAARDNDRTMLFGAELRVALPER